MPKVLRFEYVFLLLVSFALASRGELAAQTPPANTVRWTAVSTSSCCFELAYQYERAQAIDRLEVEIMTSDVFFSTIHFDWTGDWQLATIVRDRQLRWTYALGEIPSGTHSLFDFCLEGWNTASTVALKLHWYAGNTRLQTDTLHLSCTACWSPKATRLVCEEDQSYTYTFSFQNDSEFTVDQLSIYEPDGQNFIAQETISLSTPLAPGGITPPISLAIDAAAGAEEELCFGLTPRQYRQDTIAVACCSATYCLPLPECDTCCTAYAEYVADVNAGFQILDDCEGATLRLQANALNACDRVRYLVSGLGGGVVDGNETFQVGGLTEGETYRICMRVTRQSVAEEDCYDAVDLEVCQTYTYNCCVDPENVDEDIDCPPIYDPVCACDGQTYLNSCTALNWGGIFFESWTVGHCDSLRNCDIEVEVSTNPVGDILLEWTNTRPDPIRYYLVQRRGIPAPPNPPGPWISLSAPLSPLTTSYTDDMPLSPIGEYRVLAVTEAGTLIYGEQDPDCIKGTSSTIDLEGGRLWPNPTHNWLEVELPIARSVQLQVYNLLGQVLHQLETDDRGRARLSTVAWPAGTYWLVGKTPAGRRWRRAFVVAP